MEGTLSSKETKEQKEETGPGMPPVGMDEATVNSDPVVTSPRPATRDFTLAEASTQHPSLGHSSSVGEVPQLVSPTWLTERLRLGLDTESGPCLEFIPRHPAAKFPHHLMGRYAGSWGPIL